MEITFTVAPADMLAYNLYFQRVSSAARRGRRAYLVAMALIAVGAVILVDGLLHDRSAVIGAAVGGLVLVGLSPFLRRFAVRRAIARHLADPRVQGTFGEYRLKFSREGIHATSPIAESQIKWANVNEIVPDGDRVYVCLSSSGAWVISRASYRGQASFEMLPVELDRVRRGS